MRDSIHSSRRGSAAEFRTTHWAIVAAAGAPTTAESQRALAALCEQYWYPLYAYIRRSGRRASEAEDLTQAFFAMLLEKKAIRNADPRRGRFRSYLLGTLKNFLANENDRARALKRGGGRRLISLDADAAEGRFGAEPSSGQSPEHFFDRQWALTILSLALAELRSQFAVKGKEEVFEKLQGCLGGDELSVNYRQLGEELGMSEGAVKVAVHRLRKRYREIVREQIAQTVDSPDDLEDEIRYLFAALRA